MEKAIVKVEIMQKTIMKSRGKTSVKTWTKMVPTDSTWWGSAPRIQVKTKNSGLKDGRESGIPMAKRTEEPIMDQLWTGSLKGINSEYKKKEIKKKNIKKK